MAHSTYAAHPAIGFVRVDDSAWPAAVPPTDSDLGEFWEAIDDNEKDRRERLFFTALLGYYAHLGALLEAELPLPAELMQLRAAYDQVGIEPEIDSRSRSIRGPLLAAVIDVLVVTNPIMLRVSLNDAVVLSLHDSWNGVLVRADEEEEESLRQLMG